LKADTYELRTILALERRYVIPTFQRDYEWTERGQWELLFDDLEAVAERLEAERRKAALVGLPVIRADKMVAPHFLGAVVLDMLPTSAGSLDVRSVIDGQQRLTTVQLLIRAVLDVLIEIDSPRVAQVRRLIQNPGDVVTRPEEQHKLWPRRRDRGVWQVAMADEHPRELDHLYLKARDYFAKRTRETVSAPTGDRSDLVIDALLSLFKIVVIDLEDNDDAQVIFEVLNGRQTPLSATDLVKNLLFLRAELDDERELERLYEEYWSMFDEAWWREEVGRGHAARGRRDLLLGSWLTAATGREVNVGHLYGEVRRHLEDGQRTTVDVLPEIRAYARAFRAISEPSSEVSPEIASAYRRLNRLQVTTALPLLTWLRTVPSDVLPPAMHARTVCAIDSWVMRRILIGANTRGYGKKFIDVLKAAQAAAQNKESITQAVEQSLLAPGDNLYWISDREIEDAFLTRPFYTAMSQERLRMVLGALDAQMHAEDVMGEAPQFDYDRLHIEHVLPQAWQEHWPIFATDDAQRAAKTETRERAKHRIGNLTLLAAPLNGPLSNSGWITKKPAMQTHAALRLTRDLLTEHEWNENAIENRAKALAELACRVWSRPGA
jgi:hypothetical protein